MKDDFKMNSIALQKHFPATYKDFFSQHDIVLSSCGVLTWGVDVSHGISPLRIKQKLPIKTFIGVNLHTSKKIELGSILHFSPLKNAFEEDDFSGCFKNDSEAVLSFLAHFLAENGHDWGMQIDVLTESPLWHGFAFSWVVSVLLSYLLHIVVGKLLCSDLKDQTNFAEKSIFEEVYRCSILLSLIISGGSSAGATNYATMTPDIPLPIVCFIKKNNSDHADPSDRSDTEIDRDATLPIYKDSLLKFLKIDAKMQELPLDYWIVSTGLEYTYSEIESTRESIKKESKKLSKFIADLAQVLPTDELEKSEFSRLLDFDRKGAFITNIIDTNVRILEWFNYLLKNRYDDGAVNAFIEIIKKSGLTSFMYQKENKLFFAIQYLFYKYRHFEDEEIGILPFNTGKIGGSLLFVMKNNKSRATILKVLEHLRNEGEYINLDYASWRDGYSPDGVCLEQLADQGIYSAYTKERNVVFSDNVGKSYFWEYDTIIENEINCILLDTIKGRIYIKGTKLTSKDIHSQNTTIDMMRILLENIGKEVSNSKLPSSTYSKNKNEILSKVVLPIRKLSKKYFWSEILLTCSGWISDYYLRLDKDESIQIGIIKKIRN